MDEDEDMDAENPTVIAASLDSGFDGGIEDEVNFNDQVAQELGHENSTFDINNEFSIYDKPLIVPRIFIPTKTLGSHRILKHLLDTECIQLFLLYWVVFFSALIYYYRLKHFNHYTTIATY